MNQCFFTFFTCERTKGQAIAQHPWTRPRVELIQLWVWWAIRFIILTLDQELSPITCESSKLTNSLPLNLNKSWAHSPVNLASYWTHHHWASSNIKLKVFWFQEPKTLWFDHELKIFSFVESKISLLSNKS
jgi:hypothetical protein